MLSEQDAFEVDTEKIERVKNEVCDKLCRWPTICTTEEELTDNFCVNCPLNGLDDVLKQTH